MYSSYTAVPQEMLRFFSCTTKTLYSTAKNIFSGYSSCTAVLQLYFCTTGNITFLFMALQKHCIIVSLSLLCPPIWAVLHHLYMYMVAFLALRILYVIALVCFVFVPCSPPESLPGKDVLCRLLPRPLPSVCFLFFSFLFRPCSPPICFGETSSIL